MPGIFFFQLSEYFICPVYQCRWHSCHPCHMDTEAVSTSSRRKLSQEDYFVANLLIRDMKVLDPLKFIFQFIELMIMCSEKCFRRMWRLMDIFCNAPCNGNPVIGRGTPSNLIK